MTDRQSQFESRQIQLRQKYANGLEGKIREFHEQWAALKQRWREADAREFYRSVHNLGGSSATYGADDLANHAREFEQVLLAIIYDDRNPTGDDVNRIDHLLGLISVAATSWAAEVERTGGRDAGNQNQDTKSPERIDAGESIPEPEIARDSRRFRLLYIEDNLANLNLVKQLVGRRENMELYTAQEPAEGLKKIATHRLDAVLLDINLPMMSGYEVLARIRASKTTSNLPVVALSANAMPEDLQRGLDAGFNDYITKPIQIEQFFEVLDRILSGKQD